MDTMISFPIVQDLIILSVLSLVGAFGGYLSAVQRHITRSTDPKTTFKVSQMLQGAAGAIIIVTLSPVDPHILSAPFATAADQSAIDFFIKLIALALIGGYAGGSLLESSAKQYAKQIDEKIDEIEQRVESQEEEQKRTRELVRNAEEIFRGLKMSASELARFEKAVQESSTSARYQIAYRADEVRRQHWQKDKKQLKRSELIFRSLLKTGDAKLNHWWYASLGYCLKDMEEPNYLEAIRRFDEAIEIRGQEAKSGAYEFNRAICYIKLDNPTNPIFTKGIQNDLYAASKCPRFGNIIDACPDVIKWRESLGLPVNDSVAYLTNVIDAHRITKDAA
jgi:tetratricopeptide (TPR) repeat protein